MAKLLEPDVSTRLLRVTNAFNDVLYSCANEPSLGMYRIQEHVTISVPRLVEQQQQLRESLRRVEGASYDLEYDSKTLVDMSAITQFGSIKNKLLRAIELRKKLDEQELMRKRDGPSLHSLPPSHSSQQHQSPPLQASLPPIVTKATPTINLSTDGAEQDSGPYLVPDMGIRPKSFD